MRNTDKIKGLQFDIDFIKNQITDLKYWIENGCWIGYSDNLKVRKERLKHEENDLKRLEKELKQLTISEQLNSIKY